MSGPDTSGRSTSPKIALLGPMAPFRGGIAQFNDRLRHELEIRGSEVLPVTFSRQYPELLFPGTSQYDPELEGDALAIVDSLNPLSWRRAGARIRAFDPAAVVVAYWTPHLAPALTGVVRASRAPAIGLMHNALPHKAFPFAGTLLKSLLKRLKGVLALSDHVGREVVGAGFSGPVRVVAHPPYDRFGSPMERDEARERLGLSREGNVLLCFGLVREYKGFGTAVRAMDFITEALPEVRLVIAGEAYSEDVDQDLASVLPGTRERIVRDARYIPDEEVAAYFSAADLLLLPYMSATQSGPLAIAEHFGLPAVATDVGALGDTVRESGAGVVVEEPGREALARAVIAALEEGELERLRSAASARPASQAWSSLAQTIETLAAV